VDFILPEFIIDSFTLHLISGIITVLTMMFLGLEAKIDLPKVPYPIVLDFFVFLSFTFIFATIIQFAVVYYFTKYESGECYFSSNLIINDTESLNEEESVTRRSMKNQPILLRSKKTLIFTFINFYLFLKSKKCWDIIIESSK